MGHDVNRHREDHLGMDDAKDNDNNSNNDNDNKSDDDYDEYHRAIVLSRDAVQSLQVA